MRLFDSKSAGRPRPPVLFESRFSRATSQSRLSRPSRGNPLPIPTDCAGYLTERTHDTVRLDSAQRLHAEKHRVLTQSYCRFQVNFAYVSDATQFINAIRPVCPCKEIADGPPPPPIPVNKSLVPRSVFIQVRARLYAHQTSLPAASRSGLHYPRGQPVW